MAAYYNEVDAHAASWLHNLNEGQARTADSASGQQEHGTSGTAPTPSRAMHSSLMIARHRCGGARACAPRQARAARRSFHTRAGRLGWSGRNGLGCLLAAPSLWRERDTLALSQVSVNGMFGPIARCWRVGNHQSRATYYVALAQARTSVRTYGNCDRGPRVDLDVSADSAPCKPQSNTACSVQLPASQGRIRHTSGLLAYGQCATFSQEGPL